MVEKVVKNGISLRRTVKSILKKLSAKVCEAE
jgi:hypothetical protein